MTERRPPQGGLLFCMRHLHALSCDLDILEPALYPDWLVRQAAWLKAVSLQRLRLKAPLLTCALM